MSIRAEQLYTKLNSKKALEALIGTAEDADFDCKVWFGESDAIKGSLAKAVCGFTNATGGVVIIGMEAKGRGADIPDTVKALRPVDDREAVKSRALDLIQNLVDIGIEGIQAKTVAEKGGGKGGYVLILVPESEDSPRRSKIDWRFYVRIASGTVPMEIFQIADRFGRRPHPKLVLELGTAEFKPFQLDRLRVLRQFKLSIRNDGRGIARFPCVRFKKASGLSFDNNHFSSDNPIWAINTEGEWHSARAGANDVIYPGEVLKIASLVQDGNRESVDSPNAHDAYGPGRVTSTWDYPATTLEAELFADNMVPFRRRFTMDRKTYPSG
jgi:hypothetical protein